MAMSKKHYEQIAACFQRSFADVRTIADKDVKEGVSFQLAFLVDQIANVCKADNPNFKRRQFLVACAQLSEYEKYTDGTALHIPTKPILAKGEIEFVAHEMRHCAKWGK